VPNGDLSKGNGTWTCWPSNCTVEVLDSPYLNVTTWLRIAPPPCCYPNSQITLASSTPGFDFSVTSPDGTPNSYELSFVAHTPYEGQILAIIRQNHDPWTNLAATTPVDLSPDSVASTVRYVTPTGSDSETRIDFQVPLEMKDVFLSEISIRGIDLLQLPQNTSLVLLNPTFTPQDVTLPPSPLPYFDVNGDLVRSPVLLPPFSSFIVVQNSSSLLYFSQAISSSHIHKFVIN